MLTTVYHTGSKKTVMLSLKLWSDAKSREENAVMKRILSCSKYSD